VGLLPSRQLPFCCPPLPFYKAQDPMTSLPPEPLVSPPGQESLLAAMVSASMW
jgi:hypothetical protein